MAFTTNNYEIAFLDIKNADCAIIRCTYNFSSYIVIIDAGNVGNGQNIKNELRKHFIGKITIDLAICTHTDKDHIGGFFDILDDPDFIIYDFWLIDPATYLTDEDIKNNYVNDKFKAVKAVRKIFDKPNDPNENLIEKIISNSSINGLSVSVGTKHETIPVKVMAPTNEYYSEIVKQMVEDYGIVTYEESDTTIYDENALPDKDDVKSNIDLIDDKSPYNASSIVILFEPENNKKFLFTGDSNCAALSKMIDEYSEEVKNITLLKVPHHGSKHNLTTEIISHLAPTYSLISAQGSKKHPNSGVVYWLSKHGNVYSTHKSGNLYYVTTEVNNPAIPLRKKNA